MEESDSDFQGESLVVQKRKIWLSTIEVNFFRFITALYSLSVHEFFDNWRFIFKCICESMCKFSFFEAFVNRMNEVFLVFSSEVTPEEADMYSSTSKMNILLFFAREILAYTRVKVKVTRRKGRLIKTWNLKRQEVGERCLNLILKQFSFRVRSDFFESVRSYGYNFRRLLVSCFQSADVNPIFEYIIQTHPQLLTKCWSLESFTLKRVFFPLIATLPRDIEVSDKFEISGVAALIYLDQHVPNSSSVSVTELLLKHGLVDENTRDPHGFHVIFGSLFRTFNDDAYCRQRAQWRIKDDYDEDGSYLFGFHPFLNAAIIGIADEIILRDKLWSFAKYNPKFFFVPTEKPSDPESKYFILYNDNPEEDYVDESRMMTYLAKHQICFYELIRDAAKNYFREFCSQPDPDGTLWTEDGLRQWDVKKRPFLRLYRFFRRIKSHILYNRVKTHPYFATDYSRIFVGQNKDGSSLVLQERYVHLSRDKQIDLYYKEHYGHLGRRERRKKARSVLLRYFKLLFMFADLTFPEPRPGAVQVYRPWNPVGTEEDGGVIHDTDSDLP